MKQILIDNLAGYYAGECQSSGGLAILPLFRKSGAEREFVSLHQALQQGAVVISEVSAGGSVPNLKVLNRGRLPVLLLDGEELRGAKQNRVLNASVLVPGESELLIPVSCTEAGRWSYRSDHFEESGNVMAASLKPRKMDGVTQNLKFDVVYQSNQGQVWDDIDDLHRKHGSRSQTSAMADVFQAKQPDLEEFCRNFPLLEGQCGFYAASRGRFSGIDVVSRPEVWADIHAKIVRSYAIDVLSSNASAAGIDPARLDELLANLIQSGATPYQSVGLGTDLRLAGAGLIGSALVWENEIVHLAAYPKPTVNGGEDRYHSPRNRRWD